MAGESRVNVPEWSVSELSAALKRTVEDAYGHVRVRGEISGFKGASGSGHVYFRLKDDRAVLEAVVWKGVFGRLRFRPEEGLEVIASGKLTTFPGSSKYQIVIDTLEPAGIGALMALLEERKKKLAAEGLFDEARKQLLPFLPEVIGVVTSPTGAVIRDILHRLSDRFPRRVLVWPVRVQGDGSAEEVAAAIRGFNALPEEGPLPRPDLLIVARGGGSLEDLWSFNEEIVVRAAADSLIPLISAVGHETDVTLIDFAADRRAPTPTAAAEMAVPVRAELMGQVDGLARRALACWMRSLDARRTELRAAARALPTAEGLMAIPRQRFDACADRLPRALRANAQVHRTQFSRAAAQLTPQLLRGRLRRDADRVDGFAGRARQSARILLERRRDRFATLAQRLGSARIAYGEARRAQIARAQERLANLQARARRALAALLQLRHVRTERAERLLAAFSYRGVLARGFALVRDGDGRPLRSAMAVGAGMRLEIEFADGRVAAKADGDGTAPPAGFPPGPAPPVRPRSRGGGDQGSLF